jgi:DNA modification methylase
MQTEIPFDLGELDVSQRADYTFKYNTNLGRHGWLRLTPAYSVKLVHEIIREDCQKGDMILDPFSGTATTGLVASELGFSSVLYEINPFLIWLGNIKCRNYPEKELEALRKQFAECIEALAVCHAHWIPPIHNIERWWHKDTLTALASIRSRLVETFGEPDGTHCRNLVWVAFSRLVIETSSAAFNHISMSFKDATVQYGLAQIKHLFQLIFNGIIISAKTQLPGKAHVVYTDSKMLSGNESYCFDALITSPPYPNRISYIRELRPYMYWGKFLSKGSDAGALDWEAIGGTWGVATSNLKNWRPINSKLPHRLYEVCENIRLCRDKHAEVMSRYVHKYFDDIYSHLISMLPLLKPNAKVNYIVGNSSFYGHFVETQELIAECMRQIGYDKISIHTVRRRNSKKGLLEYNVKASHR